MKVEWKNRDMLEYYIFIPLLTNHYNGEQPNIFIRLLEHPLFIARAANIVNSVKI